MIDEKNLIVFDKEQFVEFCYLEHVSMYDGKLRLYNPGYKPIYFYVCTTFAQYCQCKIQNIQLPIRKIEPQQQLFLQFRIKPTNQISSNKQQILISYGYNPHEAYFTSLTSHKKIFTMKFTIDIIEDETIQQFLKSQAQMICQEAQMKFKQSKYNQAKNLFEQSFLMYRIYERSLIGTAKFFIAMQKYQDALQRIEASILINQQQTNNLLPYKLICICHTFNLPKIQLRPLIHQCKAIVEYIKQKNLTNDEQTKQFVAQSTKIIADIQSSSKKSLFNQYVRGLLTKVQDSYDQSIVLQQNFKDREEAKKIAQELLMKQTSHNIQAKTPDYVLDPISYEIFHTPMITPSGNTYQQKPLLKALEVHGNKDPISRRDLYPHWIKPNNALLRYIKEHSDLQKWKLHQLEQNRLH